MRVRVQRKKGEYGEGEAGLRFFSPHQPPELDLTPLFPGSGRVIIQPSSQYATPSLHLPLSLSLPLLPFSFTVSPHLSYSLSLSFTLSLYMHILTSLSLSLSILIVTSLCILSMPFTIFCTNTFSVPPT